MRSHRGRFQLAENDMAGEIGTKMRHALGKLSLVTLLVLVSMVHANTEKSPMYQLPGSQVVGSGKLTWFGMTVYRATLYAPDGRYRRNLPHAIEISYQFAFSRKQLARASLEEIEGIYGEQPDEKRVMRQFESIFRDVVKGDNIIGVHHPGRGAEFYSNQVLLGRIDDPSLAAAFFAIWLDPRTSEPDLRTRLLGYST